MKPPLTSDEKQRLEQEGFLALPGMVDKKQTAAMKVRLEELLEATPQKHAGTLIVGNLIEDERFDPAWNQKRILAAVEVVLGGDVLLQGVSSRGLRPGHGQQALHVDWGGQGSPGEWYLCHAICALVDFTPANGSTRVIPRSHRNPWMLKGIKDPRKPHPNEVQLLGSAGAVFILNVHCLHSAVHNGSDHARLALFASFSRRDSPLLQLNPHVNPDARVLSRFDDETRRLLTV